MTYRLDRLWPRPDPCVQSMSIDSHSSQSSRLHKARCGTYLGAPCKPFGLLAEPLARTMLILGAKNWSEKGPKGD